MSCPNCPDGYDCETGNYYSPAPSTPDPRPEMVYSKNGKPGVCATCSNEVGESHESWCHGVGLVGEQCMEAAR